MFEKLTNKITGKKSLLAENHDFIQQNRNFWSSFPVQNNGHKLLVEEPSIPVITHDNAIFTIVLNQAKSLTPVWLHSSHCDIELLKSYVPLAEYKKIHMSSFQKLRIAWISIRKFLSMYRTKDILSFSYDNVKYGDIVYDTYLATFKVATIKKIDLRIFFIIYFCILRHENIRKILGSDSFEAVLVAHPIGISCGVMLRAALRYGYKGYLRVGDSRTILQCYEAVDEVYDYPMKPTPEEIDTIISTLGANFETAYEEVYNKQISNKHLHAFKKHNKYYQDRESFNNDYGLDPKKKNVFVMLHAFNDHPHSHFRWMLVKDYYDWFIETLKFAKKNSNVNWIFKQHPAIKLYPTKDVSFEKLFADCPRNVIYISEDNQINTKSLIYCADLVITCLGSAGFELPAMAGIPSVTAGETFYMGLGFALEPKTKDQYFEILSNAHNIERLTPEKRKRAQAAYLYLHRYALVTVSACPIISEEEGRDSNANIWYWKKVSELYNTDEKIIKDELNRYIVEVAKPEFKRLNDFLFLFTTK